MAFLISLFLHFFVFFWQPAVILYSGAQVGHVNSIDLSFSARQLSSHDLPVAYKENHPSEYEVPKNDSARVAKVKESTEALSKENAAHWFPESQLSKLPVALDGFELFLPDEIDLDDLGRFSVVLRIDRYGFVTDASYFSPAGVPIQLPAWSKEALNQLRKLRFVPGERQGVAVDAEILITVFSADSDSERAIKESEPGLKSP